MWEYLRRMVILSENYGAEIFQGEYSRYVIEEKIIALDETVPQFTAAIHLAHELGHHLDMVLDNGAYILADALRVANYVYSPVIYHRAVLSSERIAWVYGEQTLQSVGFFNAGEKNYDVFSKMREAALNTYEALSLCSGHKKLQELCDKSHYLCNNPY